MIDRRALLAASAIAMLPGCASATRSPTKSNTKPDRDRVARLAALEQASGGRLGAYVLDIGSGTGFGWRKDERFCHCSSFKLSLAALALHEAAAGRLSLQEVLPYGPGELLPTSPVTSANVERGGLAILELARAAQVFSDNAAANLLMRRLGGPGALTRFWRSLGDRVSRLDAYEPVLNRIPPGTQENSTTPAAMAHNLARMLYGNVLGDADAERLRGWMRETRTGIGRIRAGLPNGWDAGDKTGTAVPDNPPATYVDVAFVRPPGAAPLIVTGYFEDPARGEGIRPEAEAVLASVGRIAAQSALPGG